MNKPKWLELILLFAVFLPGTILVNIVILATLGTIYCISRCSRSQENGEE